MTKPNDGRIDMPQGLSIDKFHQLKEANDAFAGEKIMEPKKKITSIPGLFGGTDHYDEDGNLVGYSLPGIFGGVDHYNADGSSAGYSIDGPLGGMDHYDANGHNTGYSVPGIIGGTTHYDEMGKLAGYSTPNIIAGNTFHSVSGTDQMDPFAVATIEWE